LLFKSINMSLSKQQLLDALSSVKHPETRISIVEAGMIENLELTENKVSFMLNFKKAKDPFSASMKKTAEAALKKLDESLEIDIRF